MMRTPHADSICAQYVGRVLTRRNPPARPRTSARGFTLLEVLVALGIAATSLVALYSLAGQLSSSAGALELRQWALWCADNRLVAASLDIPAPPLGQTEHACTQAGRTFAVTQTISTTPNAKMRRIELSVNLNAAPAPRSERLAFLATVLPVQGGEP